jgi:hypothetical protein
MSTANPSVLSFDVVKRLTTPFLIIPDDGTPKYLRFETAIKPDDTTFSERVRKAKPDAEGKQNTAPMNMAKVVDLQTGEEFRLVVHEVLHNTLQEAYPNDSYVGKMFEIKKTKRAGKRYFSFDVTEIRLKSDNSDTKKK